MMRFVRKRYQSGTHFSGRRVFEFNFGKIDNNYPFYMAMQGMYIKIYILFRAIFIPGRGYSIGEN